MWARKCVELRGMVVLPIFFWRWGWSKGVPPRVGSLQGAEPSAQRIADYVGLSRRVEDSTV